MDKDEQVEMVREILDHLTNSEAPQWRRIRIEIQWLLFWALAKAIILFWAIYVVILLVSNM